MKVIERLPEKSLADTIRIWRNALRLLDDSNKAKRRDARKLLEAIKAEWIRRSEEPISAEEAFSFPTTDAAVGFGTLDASGWQSEGEISYMGYRVGNTAGEPTHIRKNNLDQIFTGPIPPAFPTTHLAEWGEPETLLRLKKLAETIASLTRNAKRDTTNKKDAAIRDWESDLDYIYNRYYSGKYYFIWPLTTE